MKNERTPLTNSIKFFIIYLLLMFIFISSGYTQEINTASIPAAATQLLTAPSVDASAEKSENLTPPETIAMTAAAADMLTTSMVMASGGVEMNPVVSPSPLGLIALAGTKIGLIKYAGTLPETEKRVALKSASSVWGGAAVNNIAVFLAVPPPFPMIAGLIMVFSTWNSMTKDYEAADKILATSLAKKRNKNDEYHKLSIANIK